MAKDDKYGIDPAAIMHEIIDNVKKNKEGAIASNEHGDIDVNKEPVLQLEEKLSRLKSGCPSLSEAHLFEPTVGSRFKTLGRFIVFIRKFGARLFTKWYAGPVFDQQSRINASLVKSIENLYSLLEEQVRVNQELMKDKGLLIEEVDKKLNDSLTKIEQIRFNTEQELKGLVGSVNELRAEAKKELKTVLDTAENRVRDLQNSKQEEFEQLKAATQLEIRALREGIYPEFPYDKFSERFSGSDKDIKEIYNRCVNFFKDCHRVLDVGCGKGIFLEIIQEQGINGYGIDSSDKMVELCQRKGFEAFNDDAINHLSELKRGSIDGVFLGHVIEHLPFNLKQRLLQLSFDKLDKGGVIFIQTPNTISSYVMHNLYYLDPTHQSPIHPETYKLLAENIGFNIIDSYLSEEIPEEALKEWNNAILQEAKNKSKIEYYNFSLVLEK